MKSCLKMLLVALSAAAADAIGLTYTGIDYVDVQVLNY